MNRIENMSHKNKIWISISLTAFLLTFFLIIILNYIDKSVDNNYCIETALEDFDNNPQKIINIPLFVQSRFTMN